MTNHEIISNNPDLYVHDIMDLARKDEAVAFAEWAGKNFWVWNQSSKCWFNQPLAQNRCYLPFFSVVLKMYN